MARGSGSDLYPPSVAPTWTFLTNHTLALLCVVRTPGMRLRDIAAEVGITERAAHRIMSDLVEAGFLTRHRVGRRNFYEVHPENQLRHHLVEERTLGDLIGGLIGRLPPPDGSEPADVRAAR
jgi:IclR helix-turn-helix domain